MLEEIDKCDFVVDQLYSDSPLAGFAAEAASFQKIPVVGGYGWDEIRQTMSEGDIPPAKLCHPDNLLGAVEELCKDVNLRKQMTVSLEEFLTQNNGQQRHSPTN